MTKIEQDLINESNSTVKRIAGNLIEQGKLDKYFMETLNKPNKSLKEMWMYIWQEAKKLAEPIPGISGGVGVDIDDAELTKMAKHYYDEDSIVINKPKEAKLIKSKEKVDEIVLPKDELDDFDF